MNKINSLLYKFDNYIFDLDGTIINSSNEVLNCFKLAFKKANYNIEESKFTSNVIGPPLKQIIKILTPELNDEDKILEIIKHFREIYDYDENDVSVMYDGVYDFLVNLQKQGKKLFIATFKPKIPTMRLIKKFNLNMFDDVYTIDKFNNQITKAKMIEDIIEKYKLNKNETVMIGDSASDIIAAEDNNIVGIGALWGYGDDKTNLKNSATYIIKNIEELKCLKLN